MILPIDWKPLDRLMAVQMIQQFMEEHPDHHMPFGSGWIDPQAALDLLAEGPEEVIDALKNRGTKDITGLSIPAIPGQGAKL